MTFISKASTHRSHRSWASLSINHLLSATAVVFEKLLQWSTVRKHWTILFLMFPYLCSMLMDKCPWHARTNWQRYLCPIQMRRIHVLQKKTHQTLLISWHWCEWWQQFQKNSKVLHLSWKRFFLTKRISTNWLGCRLLLRKFHQSCRRGKERYCNKDNYKTTKTESP